MEVWSSILLPISYSLLLLWVLRITYLIWWKPKMLERHLHKQGIKGPPYKILYGNTMDNLKLINETWSKPMGLSHQIVPRVFPFINQLVKNYGKMSLTWVGPTPRVTILDPELAREILSNKFGHFQKPPLNPLVKLLALGLFSLDGEKWVKHRRIITPAFHIEKLKGMQPAFLTSCRDMVKRWEKLVEPQGSCELDASVELQNLTRDIISRTAFGSNYEEGKKIFELQREQEHLVFMAAQTIYIPGFRFVPTKKNLRRKYLDKEIRAMLASMILKRIHAMKNGEATKNDLLGLLLESNFDGFKENAKNLTTTGMSIEEVVQECKLFHFAGQETTSNLLTWAIVVLAMHPTWQAQAREEIMLVCEKDEPTTESLNHLKIVTMIMNEVLRLYPPVLNLIRYTYKTMTLGDITLPPGVELVISTLLVHHDTEIWGEDADEFKPERFSGGVAQAIKHQVAYIPFGWGPRTCTGQNFAIMEAKVALVMILQRFSFELSPTYAHAPKSVITLQPQHGAQIILHKL